MQGTNTGVRKRPVFTWTAAVGAVRYDLQADNQGAFTSPEVNLISYNGTPYTPPVNLPVSASVPVGTRYYIRGRGLDAAGNGEPWSQSGIRRYVNVGRFDDDANGDGYSDVLAGAPYNDAGRTNSGSAYLYFGGSAMNATSDSIFSGAAVGDEFGTSAAFAGDVNGDGYGDLIVGAAYSSAGGTNAGRAYVFLGDSTPDAQADLILTGAAAYDYLGNSVSPAGDMNGDGFDDFVICAIQNDAGGTNAGSAYVYLGGAVLIGTADLILTGQNPSDFFGSSASSAGDVNGDGYGDLIVGALYNDAGGVDAGRAYLYLGSTVLNATADLVLTGTSAYDFFGQVVAPAGDVNGDGYGDFIVGAPVNDAGGTDAGSVYLYLGGAAAYPSADLALSGAAGYDSFGLIAASAGDVPGDGYGDFIVGAPFNDAGGTNSGSAYLYFGGIGLDGTPDVILTGAAAGDSFGTSVD